MTEKIFSKSFWYMMIQLTLGAFLIAFSLQVFYKPNNLIAGGVSGISIIIYDFSVRNLDFVIPMWITNLAFNIPLLIAAAKIKGKDMILKTGYVVCCVSLFLYILSTPFQAMDILISAIFGSVILGVGLGIIFSNSATSGGTDLLASVINKFIPYVPISKILFTIDSCIILFGMYTFGIEKGLYGIIAVYVTAKSIDLVLEGSNFAKSAFIITDKPDEMGDAIMNKVKRGVTSLYGQGQYSKEDKKIIYCVVSKKQIVTLKEVCNEIDPNAFVIIGDVREVHGEGFIKK